MRKKLQDGRYFIKLPKDDPLYEHSMGGWMLEHRYLMAKRLGRKMMSGEVVTHKRVETNHAEKAKDFLAGRVSSDVVIEVQELEGQKSILIVSNQWVAFRDACELLNVFLEVLEGKNK